jgi:hypothetical protein
LKISARAGGCQGCYYRRREYLPDGTIRRTYGEGEATIKDLTPVIRTPEAWRQVKGIAFLEDDKVVVTEPRPLIQDLDTLPRPARHLLPLSRYQALGYPVSIITSRGCPYRCIFCQGRRMVGGKVRWWSGRAGERAIGCGACLPWWWDTHIESRNLYGHFAALGAFLKGEDRRGRQMQGPSQPQQRRVRLVRA